MKRSPKLETNAITGGCLATSAQPPRATSSFPSRLPPALTPQPIPLSFALRKNGTRQESLGCCGLPPVLFEKTILGERHQTFVKVGQR